MLLVLLLLQSRSRSGGGRVVAAVAAAAAGLVPSQIGLGHHKVTVRPAVVLGCSVVRRRRDLMLLSNTPCRLAGGLFEPRAPLQGGRSDGGRGRPAVGSRSRAAEGVTAATVVTIRSRRSDSVAVILGRAGGRVDIVPSAKGASVIDRRVLAGAWLRSVLREKTAREQVLLRGGTVECVQVCGQHDQWGSLATCSVSSDGEAPEAEASSAFGLRTCRAYPPRPPRDGSVGYGRTEIWRSTDVMTGRLTTLVAKNQPEG